MALGVKSVIKQYFAYTKKRWLEYRYHSPRIPPIEIYENIIKEFTHDNNQCIYCSETVLPKTHHDTSFTEITLKVPAQLQMKFIRIFNYAKYLIIPLIETAKNIKAEDLINQAANVIINGAMLHHAGIETVEGFNARNMYISFIIVYLII